jgi:hypothetical protein
LVSGESSETMCLRTAIFLAGLTGMLIKVPSGHASTLIDDRLVYVGNVTGLIN